ncbi:hypothetical protein [Saezia sanguinis]|uniref:hypothetical protein n=1 Tax=Saezia sanguinis TaxID=1965230 RepID=UPI00306CFEB9
MRIDKAYCEELGREVDIEQACVEFALQDKVSKFHFLCTDPVCRNYGVRVLAINHNKVAEDTPLKSPHFRIWDTHSEQCEWMELDEALQQEDTESTANTRPSRVAAQLQAINTRLISHFIIPDVEKEPTVDTLQDDELKKIRAIVDRKKRLGARKEYAQQAGATTRNLDSLVSCFLGLKDQNLLDVQEVSISGGAGTINFRSLFRHIQYGLVDGFAVYHGGARLYKRYGDGFALNLIDKKDGENISLYISKDDIQSYRPAKRFNRDIDQMQEMVNDGLNPYFTIYWIGGLKKGEKGYSVDFKHLSHFTMRLNCPSKKPTAPVGDESGE